MKSFKIFLYVATAILLVAFKSNNTCDSFFPQNVGAKWELTSYNDKDKVVSKSRSELMSVNDIDGGLEAVVGIETLDDKEKSMSKGEVILRCTNDNFYMDMSNMFPKDQMAGVEGAEIEMTNEFMEFPSNPVAGQTLPDAESTMTVKVNGVQMMSTSIKSTNRKIEGFEDVTTPAGTYHCVKYSSDTEVKSMMFKSKGHSVMYMAKNVGTVKMESFDEKGKLQSKMLLTSFSN